MKHLFKFTTILFIFVFLSGCLYPGDARMQSHTPDNAEIQNVQEAVAAFKKNTGVLPIKNSDENTPIYEKYPINFKKLVPEYMPNLPINAYENGGYFQYVIVDAETNPTVKVFDLTLLDIVQDIQNRVNVYRSSHGYSPLDGVISTKRFKINFKDLGYKNPPYVSSPYSGKLLSFVMDENSKIYIDYGPDLYEALQRSNNQTYKPGDDIRNILIKDSAIVPIKSLPYTVKNNDPVFLVK